MSQTNPVLQSKRIHGHLSKHLHNVDTEKNQWFCEMCRFKAAKDHTTNKKKKRKNREKNEVHQKVETERICNFCNVHFCKKCFDNYEKRE